MTMKSLFCWHVICLTLLSTQITPTQIWRLLLVFACSSAMGIAFGLSTSLLFKRAKVLQKEILKPVLLLLGCNYACDLLAHTQKQNMSQQLTNELSTKTLVIYCVSDFILLSYIGIIRIKNHDQDPYEPTSIMGCHLPLLKWLLFADKGWRRRSWFELEFCSFLLYTPQKFSQSQFIISVFLTSFFCEQTH